MRIIVFLFFLLNWNAILASTSEEGFLWGIFRYQRPVRNNEFSWQLQLRHDFGERRLVEEQFNFQWNKKTSMGDFGLLLTLGTADQFKIWRERRYALQWENDFYKKGRWDYSLRLRQEFRDFRTEKDLAYRFRLRNEVSYLFYRVWWLNLSSEFNWYQNSLSTNAPGFASHRSIFGVIHKVPTIEFAIQYIYDYRSARWGKLHRHILSTTVIF